MNRKVAICGGGKSMELFPGKDYGYDEVWTLNKQVMVMDQSKIDRLFVMDDLKLRAPFYGVEGAEFVEWLVYEYEGRTITSHLYEDLPDHIEAFPIVAICEDFGHQVGTAMYSSPDYMIAMAVHEKFDQIDMYGVDMNHNKCSEVMRNATSLWIGVATGRGLKVRVFSGSFYENFLNPGVSMEFGLYGYDSAKRPRIEHLIQHLLSEDAKEEGEELRKVG